MAAFPEYERYDALGLADLVRRREVSPAELVEAAIARIEARNPAINAVIHPLFEDARAVAREVRPEGPFAGVPFLLKDLDADYAGAPARHGSRFLEEWRPTRHAEIVRRYLAAGVVVLGLTNTPELGLMPVTEPERFGPTRNPWDPTRTPGGSSGGSAAAVAAGMVPMAGGGDGGGSIRIPASCCGLFGLKPTRGRTPVGPDAVEVWQGFAVQHVLTRSVRDSAAMLDAIAGSEPGGWHHVPPPARPFLAEVGAPPGRLRIAWRAEPYWPAEVDPECRAALEDAVRLLEELGHECVEGRPDLDGVAFARHFLILVAGETWAEVRAMEARVGRRATPRDLEAGTWAMALLGRAIGAGEYAAACRALKLAARRVAAFMDEARVDLLLSPTLARPPIPIGTLPPRGLEALAQRLLGELRLGVALRALGALDRTVERVLGFIPFTPVANATGQPSASVPLAWSREGLPIGVMLTARWGAEAVLFRLAGQLEAARPWAPRRPPLCAPARP